MKTIKLFVLIFLASASLSAQNREFNFQEYMISPNIKSPQKEALARVIQGEIGGRARLEIKPVEIWPNAKPILAIALQSDKRFYKKSIPLDHTKENLPAEGFKLFVDETEGSDIVWVVGADVRGALFGIGKLLRIAEIKEGSIVLPENLSITSSPDYSMRGHQLGYRHTANSWDAWTPEQFDQYIRELALFGSNSIEGIPFQQGTKSPHFRLPRLEMDKKISAICDSYDMDYWVWIPSEADLTDEKVVAEELRMNEDFYKVVPRLDGVFFPGGDPGDNHPKDVLAYLEKLTKILHKYHPKAGMWISLQGFNGEKVDYCFDYVNKYEPDWLTGVAYGPSSPEVDVERRRLRAKYKHRLYGDLTHTVRCQYPVNNWDQAYALTEGREVSNPQPYYYAKVLREDIIFTDGFLSYSDGAHDDVNKVIWNQVGWDFNIDVRDAMIEYCRFFFGYKVAEAAADGVLALEKNWEGPLVQNGNVKATMEYWQNLEASNPELKNNWRWQLLLVRAYYDGYTRQRLIYEKSLEKQANSVLLEASSKTVEAVMDEATAILNRAETQPVNQKLKQKIEELAEMLFQSIGLQSSVPKYQANGYERGCFMDFIDYPLNNRWWLEDEFAKIRDMNSDQAKLDRLKVIANWENPGEGGFYDNISDISASPHVTSRTEDAIDYAWWDDGFSRTRLSTQLFQFAPVLEYKKLDSKAQYKIRVSGYGEALLRANGERLSPVKYEKELETFKEFILPKELIEDGILTLSFDRPDERHLNWRQNSKVMEVWLIRE